MYIIKTIILNSEKQTAINFHKLRFDAHSLIEDKTVTLYLCGDRDSMKMMIPRLKLAEEIKSPIDLEVHKYLDELQVYTIPTVTTSARNTSSC